ncbi:DNA gyrase inhibitor YacG [Methylobacterium organophilum]|uniref:DNA gyrase inhibitor YacG n=1 Tax=Methylobacterium organophilum TaxID=410 RepID=A0ABQ4TD20_METOR|nr:DNA gyrase inhibitor YacG [Methylobacterium organophilum]GJE29123.1 DNA gyrase inhibitor YacG [Methylobacterium organophilum]
MSAPRPNRKPALAATCPICGKPAQAETAPFCSTRCADIDLGRWLGERYVISEPLDGEEETPPSREREP